MWWGWWTGSNEAGRTLTHSYDEWSPKPILLRARAFCLRQRHRSSLGTCATLYETVRPLTEWTTPNSSARVQCFHYQPNNGVVVLIHEFHHELERMIVGRHFRGSWASQSVDPRRRAIANQG